jgi:hypothetical protein
MPAQRTTIFEATEDAKWEELFQKTIEAIDLFGERPDLLKGFVDALKARDFAGQQLNITADRRRDEPPRASFDPGAFRQRRA